MRSLWALLLLAGCSGKAPIQDDFSSIGDVKSDAFSTRMRLVGTLAPGQPAQAAYHSPPRYLAWQLAGHAGDQVVADVTAANRNGDGDAVAWLVDASFAVVAQNDDANDNTLDAHVAATLSATSTYYLIVRDYQLADATFAVTLSTTSPLLRQLTGDGTTIAADWTASEGGVQFPVVTDGAPLEPWISSAHAFGARSLAFQVPTDASGHKQRVEYKIAQAADADGLHFDNARYAGFAFKVGAHPAPFLGSAIFWQAWQGYPWGPPVSLKIAADDAAPYRIKLAIRDSATGPDSTTPDVELWSAALLEADTWHTFLVYLAPRPSGGGHIKLWIDGAKVLDWSGAFGYDPAHVAGAYAGLDIKNGIYQPSANNGHTFYFDQVVFATTYAAAAAALGW